MPITNNGNENFKMHHWQYSARQNSQGGHPQHLRDSKCHKTGQNHEISMERSRQTRWLINFVKIAKNGNPASLDHLDGLQNVAAKVGYQHQQHQVHRIKYRM